MAFFHCQKCKNESLIQSEILILRAEDKIAEYLDVCNYINLIENFQKLKFILFNRWYFPMDDFKNLSYLLF